MSDCINNWIIVEDAKGTHQLSIEAVLAREGKIFLSGMIDSAVAGNVIKNMIHLTDSGIPIKIYLDSTGGEIRAGLAMIDAMELLSKRNSIDIICTGKAYSMAALLLAAGAKGHRHMFGHAEVMIHEPLIMQGTGGSASSVKSTAESLLAMRDIMSGMLSRYTGVSTKKMNRLMMSDTYLSAKEAIELGIADDIAQEL